MVDGAPIAKRSAIARTSTNTATDERANATQAARRDGLAAVVRVNKTTYLVERKPRIYLPLRNGAISAYWFKLPQVKITIKRLSCTKLGVKPALFT